MRRIFACSFAALTLALGAGVSTAGAQTTQNGLVNVNVSDVTVQIPIAVAANVCGLQVGALAVNLVQTGQATCDSSAFSTAGTVTPAPTGGPTTQTGLVNVNVSGVTVQLPVMLAANVCGVQLAALAVDVLQDGTAMCTAQGNASAGG